MMFYAALDAATCFVLSTGYSRWETGRTLNTRPPGQYCVVPCTPAAFRYLRGHGCSFTPQVAATPDGVRMVDERVWEDVDLTPDPEDEILEALENEASAIET